MAMYYNGKKVRNLYYNGKCITRLALGKEMTRLVEGDDFVRAQWLIGDGTAYINTLHNTNEDLDWETKVDNIRENTFLFWFRTIHGMGDESMIVRTTPSRFRYANNSNEFEDNLTPQPINIETFGNTIFVNGVGHSITKYYPRPSILFRLFYAEVDAASQATVDTSYTTNSVKCAYFALRNGNVYVMYLVPCRLLRPIPATLDGNGISRNAGECGMFDAVSGKFYGNVASSGTFTVEPSLIEGVDYERHKWLVADIPIGTTMMSLPINSSTFNCTIEHTGARANLQHLYSDGYIYYTESRNMDMIAVWNISEANTLFSASVGSLMIIESNEEYFKVNNISIPKYGFPILRMVIQSSYNSNNATTTKTSSITIDGIDRYIPIRLLRPLPSYLDANGKARKQFECGMLDLKTMKFYGNVAATGNFTVSDN